MIDTERLILRNWREGELESFVGLTNTPGVMRWLGGVKDPELLLDRLRIFNAWQEERGFTFWAVERKTDGEILGFCGLKLGDDPGSPVEGEYEAGWRFREDAWGQGYAREAAAATLGFAFNKLGVEQVVALTVEGNSPSWGLMLRLGMKRRPELDYQGPDWAEGTVIVHSIGKEEWQARTS